MPAAVPLSTSAVFTPTPEQDSRFKAARRLIGATVARQSDGARFTLGAVGMPHQGDAAGKIYFHLNPQTYDLRDLEEAPHFLDPDKSPEYIEWDELAHNYSIMAVHPLHNNLNL